MEPRNMQEREGEAALDTAPVTSQGMLTTPVVDVRYTDTEDRERLSRTAKLYPSRYLPSVKTLRLVTHERAKELRSVLEITKLSELEALLETGEYPATASWYHSCHHPLEFQTVKLSIASEITECYGVEYIQAGLGQKSPAIEYCNAGDPYAVTLMHISGRGYRVGCWGDIVERGNYA